MTEEEMELDISHAQDSRQASVSCTEMASEATKRSKYSEGEDDLPTSTLVDSVIGEQLGVTLYKRASNDEGNVVQCVVCLCEMEEGDEIRKLNCEHLFHRACLDKWFEHRRSTCPLCRGNLVSWEAKARIVGGATDDDDDVLSSILPFVVTLFSIRNWAWGKWIDRVANIQIIEQVFHITE
ncbi:E3 ubiquitin-protein ligase RHA2A [Acorus calamus]|uniref:E3 ubiquitin-protein ligase RHA2A n=1 Tax=Acorus calamus TaxID=4465 RepID=A0AAV9F298_ACOCL|nr:E3 ubiquitin-protein ligase RHA2A [Acorus calamus]